MTSSTESAASAEIAREETASAVAAAMCNEVLWFIVGFLFIRIGLRLGLVPYLRIELPWKGWSWSAANAAADKAQRHRAVSKAICADGDAGLHQAVLETWHRESQRVPLPADALATVAVSLAHLFPAELCDGVLAHMRRHGGDLLRPAALHASLMALIQSGHLDRADELAARAREQLGLGGDVRTRELLAGGHALAGHEAKVDAMLRELHESGGEGLTRVHAAALRGFLRAEAVTPAARQLLELQRRGTPPPARTLVELLRLACNRSALKPVLDVLDDAVPLPAEAVAPALAECLLHEDHATANRLERLVRAHGPLNYATFEMLLKLNAKADGDHAVELLKEMQSNGFFASEGLCGSLLARCAEVENLKFADALYEYLRGRSMMSLALYKTLMKVYACCGLLGRACDLYDDVVRDGIEPDRVMYGCLVKFAVKCGRTSLSRQLFEKAKGGDIQNYMWLMRAAGREGDTDRALALLRQLRDSQAESLDVAVYNCALDVCVTNGDILRAKELLSEMDASGLQNQVTFNTLMKGHVAKGDLQGARRVLSQMLAAGHTPDVASYNGLLSATVSVGDLDQAWGVISEMDRSKVTLDHYSVSIMMKAARRAKNPSDADRALAILDRPGVNVCEDEVLLNTALDACIHRKDMTRLARVVAAFSEAKLRPSVHTYGLLIKGYSMLKQLPCCQELWKEMTQLRSIEPTDVTLSCMLDALVSAGMVEEAMLLFRKWQPVVPANTVIYATLIKGFASIGDAERAMDMFHELRAKGHPMNLVTYTTLIDAQARVGDMEQAAALLRQMEEDGCQPNLITYSSLVKGHCVRGSLGEALEAFQEMLRRGIAADAVIYNTLLDGCVRHAHFELADQLLRDMEKYFVKPTNFTISIIVKMWGKRRRLDEAFKAVRDAAKEHKLRLDTQVGTCLISACLLNRAVDTALQAFEEMRAWPDGRPDSGTYGTLIGGLLRHGYARKAAELALEALELAKPGPRALARPLSEETLEALYKALKTEGLYEELGEPVAAKVRGLGALASSGPGNGRWPRRTGPTAPQRPGGAPQRAPPALRRAR